MGDETPTASASPAPAEPTAAIEPPAPPEPPPPAPEPPKPREPIQVGRLIVALLLWLWVGAAFLAYLSQFESLALPILKALGAS